MYFYACAITISTHRRILFHQLQINRRNLRKPCLNGCNDSSCDMFEQSRRLLHLLLSKFIERRIIQRIADLIAHHRQSDRITHTKI